MKKLFLLLLIALAAIQAHAQWSYVGSAFPGPIRAFYFIDDNTGFAAGGDALSVGYVAKTTDGGVTWSYTTITGTILLRAFSFLDANTGYMCGHNGVLLKTTDGGTTWTNIYTNATQTFRAVDFINSTTGIMAGAAGTIWKTTDGGLTWSSLSLGITSDVIQLQMVDESTGYAVCSGGVSPFANGYVYKTTDGGASWSQMYSNSATGLLGMAIVDVNTIYAGGTNQYILKSSDGGATWSNVFTGLTGPAIRSGSAVSGDKIFMVDDYGYVQSTSDAGVNWSNVQINLNALLGVYFPSKSIGYAGSAIGEVYKYVEGAACTVEAPACGFASYITPTSAVLSWCSSPGAIKYSVRIKSIFGNMQFNSVATAHQVTDLNPNTKYIYQTKAYCGDPISGASGWSAKTTFWTDPLRLSDSESSTMLDVYPNPVSTAATVSFTLENEADVVASLFTLDGKEVMRITDSHFPAGTSQISFDRNTLSSGVYLLKFRTDAQTLTQKVMVQ